MPQCFPRVFHFLQYFRRVMQKLFPRLGQHNFFAQPVQKATPDIAFQRFHRVADARLREVQFSRGLGEAARACQHAKRPDLPAVKGAVHL
jgi:hypothetical protein